MSVPSSSCESSKLIRLGGLQVPGSRIDDVLLLSNFRGALVKGDDSTLMKLLAEEAERLGTDGL